MSLPDQAPRLPKTWFFVGDAILLATAALIARLSGDPFAPGPLLAIVVCVALGVILALVPILADYARNQDDALDQRQRSLEALLTNVNASAEQISIAAASLHQIAELSQRYLKHAEHLPQRLQEKINEFNARLDQAHEDEREELEKEVASLRASESEKLETVSDRIHQSVAEFTRLEATVNQHLTTTRGELLAQTNEALNRLATATTAALGEAAQSAAQTLRDAQSRLAAELDQRLAATCATHVARTTAEIDRHLTATLARLTSAAPPLAAVSVPPPAPIAAAAVAAVVEESAPFAAPAASGPALTQPASPPPSPAPAEAAPASESPAPAEAAPASDSPPAKTAPPIEAPASVPPSPAPLPPDATPLAADPDEKHPRKRAPRKPRPVEPVLDLGIDDEPPAARTTGADASESASPPEPPEPALSSDGATRLLVTAYIGIGNKLFLRGDGPGLSWQKGVPLQFVSIGKWRWETNDATTAVRGRLFKNDELECTALGEIGVEPGQQREVSATF